MIANRRKSKNSRKNSSRCQPRQLLERQACDVAAGRASDATRPLQPVRRYGEDIGMTDVACFARDAVPT